MIKTKYLFVENPTNVFEISQNKMCVNASLQGTVLSQNSLNNIIVGCLKEDKVSMLPLKPHHQYKNIELHLYQQLLSIAKSNKKGKCCWRCSQELKILNSKKVLIGTLLKVNTCSFSCSRQPYLQIIDSNQNILFTVYSSCCQLGNFIPDCCGFLRCNKSIKYEIQNKQGQIVGNIENIVKQSCGINRSFQIQMTYQNLDTKQKILLLNSILLLL